MVSKNTEVISDFVHDIHQVLSLTYGTDCITLDSITGIYKNNKVVFFHLSLVGGKSSIADIVVDGAMNIVCIKDNDVFLCFKGFSGTLGEDHCQADKGNNHDQCNSLDSVHLFPPK